MKRLSVLLLAAALTAIAVPSFATDSNHTDYWNNELGVDCTKYEGHSGFIPFHYDYVIVKGGPGAPVVYENVPAWTWVQAPLNPNTGKPYAISWVMKCKIETTTTSTSSTSTSTTSSVPEETTTTSTPSSTSSTLETSTTSTSVTSTTSQPTTTAPPTATTTPSTPETLPYTGFSLWYVAYAGLVALLSGGWMLRKAR